MSIVKNKDFTIGRYKIAQAVAVAPDSNLIGNKTELTQFIEEFEKECLITILGYTLYSEFITQLDESTSNGLVAGADVKWDKLLNGSENYFGLKKLLVPYIYFMFLENDESSHTGTGVIKESGKQSRPFPERSKAVKAWREFYKYTVGTSSAPKAWVKQSIFGNLTMYDWYGTTDSAVKPLYDFLKENKVDYPDAVMTELQNLNYYGI
jgi:hypothetical protein